MKRRDFMQYAALSGTAALALTWLGPAQWALARALSPDLLFDQSLPDTEGQEHSLSGWLGKPVVVNFWATWCPPCVKEMPDLEVLHKKYESVHFLGLAIDTAINVKTFTKKVRVSYPLLIAGFEGVQTMRVLGNQAGGLPFTVVFDAKGRLHDKVLGQIKPASLDQMIKGIPA